MPKVKPLNKIAPTYCLHQLNASATSLVCPLQQQQATCPLAWDPSLHREARCSVRRYCTVRPTEPQMTARDQGSEKHFKKDRIKSIVDQPCCQRRQMLVSPGIPDPNTELSIFGCSNANCRHRLPRGKVGGSINGIHHP